MSRATLESGLPPYVLAEPTEMSEIDRLDLQHQTWLLSFAGALVPPDVKLPPRAAVLDVGCGSGAWAIAFAQQNPSYEVTAVDIAFMKHQDKLPSNCSFHVVDVETEWSFDRKFDFIHVRMMTFAIRDWEAFLTRCWSALKPGGWIELDDTHNPYFADNVSANVVNSAFLRWGALLEQSREQAGFDARAALRHQDRLKLLGFINTRHFRLKWPVHPSWPESEVDKKIGELTFQNFSNMINGVGQKMLVGSFHTPEEQAKRMVAETIEDIEQNAAINKYGFPFSVNVGQRSGDAEGAVTGKPRAASVGSLEKVYSRLVDLARGTKGS